MTLVFWTFVICVLVFMGTGRMRGPSLPPSERPASDPVSRQKKPTPPPAPPRRAA